MNSSLFIRISDDLKATLKETGNASAYLRESAQRRRTEYTQAMEHLRGSGWATNELLAVMEILNEQPWTFGLPTTEEVAASMEDAGDLTDVLDKREVSGERWKTLTNRARNDEPTARALRLVTEEFWSKARAHVRISI